MEKEESCCGEKPGFLRVETNYQKHPEKIKDDHAEIILQCGICWRLISVFDDKRGSVREKEISWGKKYPKQKGGQK